MCEREHNSHSVARAAEVLSRGGGWEAVVMKVSRTGARRLGRTSEFAIRA
jgi:hypothetical protein